MFGPWQVKWLSLAITGLERTMLPVHSSLPCFQWALVDQMGLDAGARPRQSFSVVAVERVAHIAPVMPIGSLPAAINKETLARGKRVLRDRHGRAMANSYWPWRQIRPGELFFLNNLIYESQ